MSDAIEADLASIRHSAAIITERNFADQRLYLLRDIDRLCAALTAYEAAKEAEPVPEAYPIAATFDILERLARSTHPELMGHYARGTGGVDIDAVVRALDKVTEAEPASVEAAKGGGVGVWG
jgi:hypothetical protein